MTTLATDDFNRADAATLGTNYTAGSYGSMTLKSNKCNTAGLGISYRTAETYPADQWVQATISAVTGVGVTLWGGIAVRGATATADYYAAGLNPGDFTTSLRQRIWKAVANVRSSLAASGATDIVSNDVIYFEIQGTALAMSVNGTPVLTASDSSFSSGNPGLTGRTTTTDNPQLDDASFGDFGGAASVAPWARRVNQILGQGIGVS